MYKYRSCLVAYHIISYMYRVRYQIVKYRCFYAQAEITLLTNGFKLKKIR